jgi:hypothetical protein
LVEGVVGWGDLAPLLSLLEKLFLCHWHGE